MSQFTEDQIKKIAQLARIELGPTDIPDYAEKLTRIFGLIQELEKYDTKNVAPLAHPLDAKQPLRPDVVTEEVNYQEYLALAPSSAAELFLVPQVIE